MSNKPNLHSPAFRKISCLVIMILFGLSISAQQTETQLLSKLKKSSGTEKVKLLNELAVASRNSNRDLSLQYAGEAYILALALSDRIGQATSLKNEGIAWFFKGKNDSAVANYRRALSIFTDLNDLRGISSCQNNIGLIYQETGKYKEALGCYQVSMNADEKLKDDQGIATTLTNVAAIYVYQGENRKAFDCLQRGLSINRKQGDRTGILEKLNSLGTVLLNMSKTDEALYAFNEALSLATADSNIYMQSMCRSNIGFIYWHKGFPDKALGYLNEALLMSEEIDSPERTAYTLKTMADIYVDKKDFIKANELLINVLKIHEENENVREVAVTLTAMGKVLLLQQDIDKAIGYFNQSLSISSAIGAKAEMMDNYGFLIQAWAVKQQFNKADSFLDLHASLYAQLNQGSESLLVTENRTDTQNRPNLASAKPVMGKWGIAFIMLILLFIVSISFFPENKDSGNIN